ncbi:MAG: molybdopterin-binding protein [Pseudomonadota bacterium]
MPNNESKNKGIITAAILVIGDEILSGRTKDKNIGYMADHFTAVGIQLTETRIVADNEDAIIAAVNALRAQYDYVFTTGGIGPTHDDITADCIAKAFDVPIDLDPRALKLLHDKYEEHELTEHRLRMARIPQGADLIENSVSKAPGFMVENVIVLAGVPGIMQVMLDAVTPRLKTGRKMLSRTIKVHCPEGDVAPILSTVQESYEDVALGSYPFFEKGGLGVNIVLRSLDETLLLEAEGVVKEHLVAQGMS